MKILYPGDFVRVSLPTESQTVWCSIIRSDALNGAMIHNRPAARRIRRASENSIYTEFRDLVGFLSDPQYKDSEYSAKLVKISFTEYLEWYKTVKDDYDFLESYL